jgi:hypothetical protein
MLHVLSSVCSKCSRKRRQQMSRCDSEVRPPSLPDGVVFNVKNLHDAINQVCNLLIIAKLSRDVDGNRRRVNVI